MSVTSYPFLPLTEGRALNHELPPLRNVHRTPGTPPLRAAADLLFHPLPSSRRAPATQIATPRHAAGGKDKGWGGGVNACRDRSGTPPSCQLFPAVSQTEIRFAS